jgi:hypothetical protein
MLIRKRVDDAKYFVSKTPFQFSNSGFSFGLLALSFPNECSQK